MAAAPIPAPQGTNPILDEIDRAHATLSPAAQQAIEQAHGILGIRKPEASDAVEKSAPPVDGIKPVGIGPMALGTGVTDPINVSPTGDQATTNPDFTRIGGGPPLPDTPGISAPAIAGLPEPTRAPASGLPARGLPAGPPPLSPDALAHRAELNRITTGDQAKSGIGQIHSAWGRVPLQILDAIGSGLFPRIAQYIPGTEAHHQLEVGRSTAAVNADEAEREKEAKIGLETAQTHHAEAQANETKQKHPYTVQTGEGVKQYEPETDTWKVIGTQNDKESHNVHALYSDAVADAIKRGVNPNDDPKVQQTLAAVTALNKEQKPDVHVAYSEAINDAIKRGVDPNSDPKVQQIAKAIASLQKPATTSNAFELWHQQNPNAPAEEWLKIEEANKPGTKSEYTDFRDDYLKRKPNAPIAEVVKAFAATKEQPQKPPQALMIGPDNKAVLVQPGTQVPAGAITPGGASTEAVSAEKATAAEKKAIEDNKKSYSLAQELARNPSGPNDVALVMQFMGAVKPESMGKIRFQQAEQNFILGARSTMGDLDALLNKVRNGQKLTDQQRKEMLETMRIMANPGQGPATNAGGAGGNVIEYIRDKSGKLVPKGNQ
jgi:hypothetical protein